MTGKGGGGGGANNVKGSNNGISGIPAASRKIVQSLKEIVNCPEAEIYAMLKDCNMDPNEAVNRLLSQDPFHEVKSKREKKKENKEATDSRSRAAANNTTHRGGRSGVDRHGRGGSSQLSSNDPGVSHGRPAYKRENGTYSYAGSSSASNMTGSNVTRRSTLNSDHVAVENKLSSAGTGNDVSLSSQTPAGFQSPWMGVAGQVLMSDIVKMGTPHNKTLTMPPHHDVDHHHPAVPHSAPLSHDLHLSENQSAKATELHAGSGLIANQHIHSNDEWPTIEPSASHRPSALGVPSESELFTDPSNLSLERVNHHLQSHLDDAQPTEDDHIEAVNGSNAGPTSVSNKNLPDDGATDSSMFNGNLYGNVDSYQSYRDDIRHEAEDDTSSVTDSLQQLSLQGDDRSATPEEDNPSLIIPNHLQVNARDCSHLSFGSFGSGISAAFSGTFVSRPLKNEETSEGVDASSTAQSDIRNSEYYGDEDIINVADENLLHSTGVDSSNYDLPAVSQPQALKEDTLDAAQGNQYAFPPSTPGYTYENSQQLNAPFTNTQTSSQMQNIIPFSSVMAYTDSLQNTLLASTVQTGKEPDLPYSPFPVTQSMPTKYSNASSSMSGPSISMPEVLRSPSISTPQPTPQTPPSASVAALQQHLAMHPYSQPTLPLGPFANMIGYPLLPQSYTYMPSAFQQTFAGNSTYHQSLAAMLPQYKNSVSASSLPQSAPVASGYGFGSSTNIPAGNFPLNPSSAPVGSTIGYDDVLNSQYKDGNPLISLQQNDNSGMWLHGLGSRTMSAVPASTFYSFQGQNQQPAGFRQGQQQQLSQQHQQQQLSQQHYGALDYPNYYHSQTGLPMEHQQQNSREPTLGGSQSSQPSKQTQQLWQNSY